MNDIDSILQYDPFLYKSNDKDKIFLSHMKKAVFWHYKYSPEFKNMCKNRAFDPFSDYLLADIPYSPTAIFKTFDLLSVPKNHIIKILYSSSTSGKPSKIMIDKITARNQEMSANKILSNFLGKERRHFIIFDTEKTVKNTANGELSSRGTAIRGMATLAKKMTFVLDENLKLNKKKLFEALSFSNPKEKICYFGFTWLMYSMYLANNDIKNSLQKFLKNQKKDVIVLHIGGWKKLQDLAVSKKIFNKDITDFLQLKQGKIIDLYGMTEQLGTIYPDCEFGYKHVPIYSDIIIRDIATLQPINKNEIGFIQLLSPLPHSYPGISILSDDIGKVLGTDNCKCGRMGKCFLFERRSDKAELKGCGDTLNIEYGENINI